MQSTFKLVLCASVASAGLFAASTAFAAPDPAPSQIEEIVVTAQKRSESVQKVAAAISAISGPELARRGIATVTDLQFAVPSFHSGTKGGSTDINVRGVGTGAGGTSGVAVNIDGVYQATTSTIDLAQIDLQRVEVLRGPQGTLYGRNATGGAVNFITTAPKGEFEGSLLAGYASYDEYHVQGMLNQPLGDKVRSRLVVDYRDRQDGFVKNITPGGEDLDKGKGISARLRVAADLTSNLTFDLGVAGSHNTGPFEYITNYNTPGPDAVAANPFLAGANFVSRPWRTVANDPVSSTRDYQSASGTFTWQLPIGELKSITAFQNYDYRYASDGDGTDLSISPYTGTKHDQTVTQEVNLGGRGDRLDWVVGAFYLSETDKNRLTFSFPLGLSGLPAGAYLDAKQPTYDSKSYAVFGDATVHLTEALKLLVGARYSEDHQTAVYGSTLGLLLFGTQIPLAEVCPTRTDKLKFTSFTPRAGLQYDLNPSISSYFTYSRGYKAGGLNIYACGDDFNPEKLTSYEGGFKSRWLENTVTLNISAFHYDYSNFQVNQIVGLTYTITNAAAATVEGLEVEGAWTPDNHWTLNASASHINAVYSDFFNADSLDPAAGLQNLKGNRLNNAPQNSANLGIQYRSEPLSFGFLTARVDGSYRSRVYFREFNQPLDSQSPYGLINANLTWDSLDQKYTVRLFATNLTKEAYAQSQGSSGSIGTRNITWGAPRQVGAELKARF